MVGDVNVVVAKVVGRKESLPAKCMNSLLEMAMHFDPDIRGTWGILGIASIHYLDDDEIAMYSGNVCGTKGEGAPRVPLGTNGKIDNIGQYKYNNRSTINK